MRPGLLTALIAAGLGGGEVPDMPGAWRPPRLRLPAPPPPDDDPALIEKRRRAQAKRDRRAAKRLAAGGAR